MEYMPLLAGQSLVITGRVDNDWLLGYPAGSLTTQTSRKLPSCCVIVNPVDVPGAGPAAAGPPPPPPAMGPEVPPPPDLLPGDGPAAARASSLQLAQCEPRLTAANDLAQTTSTTATSRPRRCFSDQVPLSPIRLCPSLSVISRPCSDSPQCAERVARRCCRAERAAGCPPPTDDSDSEDSLGASPDAGGQLSLVAVGAPPRIPLTRETFEMN